MLYRHLWDKAYTRGRHGEVATLMVPFNRMSGTGFLHKIEKMPNARDLGDSEGFDSEETDDDQNRESVEVVSQEAANVNIRLEEWLLRPTLP